jgi:hypothetical protein
MSPPGPTVTPMHPSIQAELVRLKADEIARRTSIPRRHEYSPPHVVETPRPVGPDTFDPSVW